MKNYKPSSLQQIVELWKGDEELSISALSQASGLSTSLIHRYVKRLVEQGLVKKIGTAPHTRYILTQEAKETLGSYTISANYMSYDIPYEDRELMDQIFLKFAPDGKELKGMTGLMQRCSSRNFDVVEKYKKYKEIYIYLNTLRNDCGLLPAKNSFDQHVEHMYLDDVYYADQYNRMEFGRGKLAELTFYAKQSQNRILITESIMEYKYRLECFIQKNDFDALAFVPASITRQYQLLTMIDKALSDILLSRISIVKSYRSRVRIPQKSLKTREQRILNAQNTIFIHDEQISQYKRVLLIDDFVGSGSTLNETAKKLKDKGVQEVVGFAIVGNMDLTYEVINEV